MDETDTKPCGSKECHKWIISQGYDPEDYPEGICVECSSFGLLYDWMSLAQREKSANKAFNDE